MQRYRYVRVIGRSSSCLFSVNRAHTADPNELKARNSLVRFGVVVSLPPVPIREVRLRYPVPWDRAVAQRCRIPGPKVAPLGRTILTVRITVGNARGCW